MKISSLNDNNSKSNFEKKGKKSDLKTTISDQATALRTCIIDTRQMILVLSLFTTQSFFLDVVYR